MASQQAGGGQGGSGSPPIRLAFYGCGLIAEHHSVAVDRCRESGLSVSVVVCIDINPARAERVVELSGNPGCKPFKTFAEALADEGGFDAVVLMLPHDLHEAAAIEVLSADKHLLIEKPLAPTVGACERVLAAAAAAAERSAGSHVFAVAENSSFWPEVVAAKVAIDRGDIGDIVTARAHYYEAMSNKIMDKNESGDAAPKGLDWMDWRSSLARAGGGVCIDGGQHWIRPLREFLGEPVEVTAAVGRPLPAIEGESLCHAVLRFASGVIASYQCTVLGEDGVMSTAEPFFRVVGTVGEIVVDGDFAGGGAVYTKAHPQGEPLVAPGTGGFVRSYHPQMADFCTAVASGNGSVALRRPPEFAVGDLKTTLAIYASAKSGRWERV